MNQYVAREKRENVAVGGQGAAMGRSGGYELAVGPSRGKAHERRGRDHFGAGFENEMILGVLLEEVCQGDAALLACESGSWHLEGS